MLKFKPDGFFLSNGPGDPKPLTKVINTTKKILDKNYPLFGICLGHQVIALANGIKTYKMFNGHRGINHPVLNLNTGKGEITSQNHGFAVDYKTAVSNKSVKISDQHLNDQTVAGLEIKGKECFSDQYHPEAGPGPNDGKYLFDKVTNVYRSSTSHNEDQVPHLHIQDTNVCIDKCEKEFGNPCEKFCPADVYNIVEENEQKKMHINFSNCVHCKTCDIMDPYQIIDWVTPEGGGGPKYGNM